MTLKGSKGISFYTLYRAKFFNGNGSTGKLQFGLHYQKKPEEEYILMLEEIERILRLETNYGPFDVTAMLFNENAAQRLAENGEFLSRPFTQTRKRAGTTGLRTPRTNRVRHASFDSDEVM